MAERRNETRKVQLSFQEKVEQGGGVARSDLMKFWKLLSEAKFTGRPSKLTEDEVRQMAKTLGSFEPEIDAAIQGFRVFKKEDG
jgi:hypothetical protein